MLKACLAVVLVACAASAAAQPAHRKPMVQAPADTDVAARQTTESTLRAENARLQADAERVQTQMRIDQARMEAETRRPDPVYPPGKEPAPIANDAPLPQIPDAALAASRARVLAASHRHGWRLLAWRPGA